METKHIFDRLKAMYGNHSRAARALGVNPRIYRQWRSLEKIPPLAKRYLELVIRTENHHGDPIASGQN